METRFNVPPSSGTFDVPAVTSAVEHLRELGDRMKQDDDAGAVVTAEVEPIVTALRKMEAECQQSHQELETVTIRSSVLRHRLRVFPEQFKAELKDVMGAAHQLNAVHIKELKDQLRDIEESIRLAEQKTETVGLHNDVLRPELKQQSERYGNLVSQLNTTMADKAELQILLNEKQEQLSATKKKIALIESEILHFQKTMEEERDRAGKENEYLKAAIAENKTKVQETRTENSGMRKQVTKLKDELVHSEEFVASRKLAVKQAEASRDELLQLEDRLRQQEEDARLQVTRLTNRTAEILNKHERMRKEFEQRKRELTNLQRQLREDLKVAMSENGRISGIRKEVKAEFRKAKDEADREAGTLASIQERVSTSRRVLVQQAEESARFGHETNELNFRMVRLEETHKTNVGLLNEAISGTRHMLAKERAEREKIQTEQSEVSAAKTALKREQNEALAQTTQRMNSAVQEQEQLKHEVECFRQEIDESECTVDRLRLETAGAESEFDKMQGSLELEIKSLESSIANRTRKVQSMKDRLAETQPKLAVLQQEHDELSSSYESKKKEIVDLKNKKSSLQDAIVRAQREIEKLNIPHERLCRDTGRQRVDTLVLLRSHVAESEVIEHNIQQLQAKVDAVEHENARLRAGIADLQKDEHELLFKHKSAVAASAALEKKLQRSEELLELGFHTGQELEREYASRDRLVVERLAQLGEKAEQRQSRVGDIHHKLQSELSTLGDFLEVVRTKRPTDDA